MLKIYSTQLGTNKVVGKPRIPPLPGYIDCPYCVPQTLSFRPVSIFYHYLACLEYIQISSILNYRISLIQRRRPLRSPSPATPPRPHRDPTATPPRPHRDTTSTPPRPHLDSTSTPPRLHLDSTPTPPRPHPDPTSTPPRPHPNTTSTPPRPHLDPTSTPPRPHLDPTSTPPRPHLDTTSTPSRPHLDPTATPPRPHLDPTPTPPRPHPDPTSTPPRPHLDPTSTPPRPHLDSCADVRGRSEGCEPPVAGGLERSSDMRTRFGPLRGLRMRRSRRSGEADLRHGSWTQR